jgi:hypothetical protein
MLCIGHELLLLDAGGSARRAEAYCIAYWEGLSN